MSASADHTSSPAMSDSLEVEPDVSGSCKPMHDLASSSASCDVKATASAKSVASNSHQTSVHVAPKPKRVAAVTTVRQSPASTSTQSKVKPSTYQKVDKSKSKRLSRDSPLVDCKSR